MNHNECEYCNGTGDVHSMDGEWRGRCCCKEDTHLCSTSYKDSTPKLNVGDSAFEDWFQHQEFATQGDRIKQICRDSYAAGMGDPLVTYAVPQPGMH